MDLEDLDNDESLFYNDPINSPEPEPDDGELEEYVAYFHELHELEREQEDDENDNESLADENELQQVPTADLVKSKLKEVEDQVVPQLESSSKSKEPVRVSPVQFIVTMNNGDDNFQVIFQPCPGSGSANVDVDEGNIQMRIVNGCFLVITLPNGLAHNSPAA